ncbi:MAG TPA: arylesterase [Pseudomonadales bacterium]|nr:arylesterase [Pseudomonadales bacterium]
MQAWLKWWAGLILLALSICANAQTLLVMGDSLSAAYGIPVESGWVKLLEIRLSKENPGWTVVNASVSGETTSGGLARFKPLLDQHKPNVVIIELGANDGLRGLSLEDMKSNLAKMIELARSSGARVVLFGMKLPPNYGIRFTQRFEQVYADLEASSGVALQPFFLDGVAGHPELTQADGLHPVASAQPIILENVWPLLQKTLRRPVSAAAAQKD